MTRKLIMPKSCCSEFWHPTPVQHMLNHPGRLRADPAGFARRMADLLDLDAARLTQWIFARSVQESVNDPELCAMATAIAP